MTDEDEELLRRFNALRGPPTAKSSSSLRHETSHHATINEQARRAAAEDAELDAIADGRALPKPSRLVQPDTGDEPNFRRRFSQLKGLEVEDRRDGELRDDEVGQTISIYYHSHLCQVEAFLASLSAPQAKLKNQYLPSPRETHRKLSQEASAAINDTKSHLFLPDEGEEPDDFETEQEITTRALAETKLDEFPSPTLDSRMHSPSSPPERLPSPPRNHADNDQALAFPSLPHHQLLLGSEEEHDEPTKATMSCLMGLSGPSESPGTRLPSPPKREVGKGWNLPGYEDARDDDIESWCCEFISPVHDLSFSKLMKSLRHM